MHKKCIYCDTYRSSSCFNTKYQDDMCRSCKQYEVVYQKKFGISEIQCTACGKMKPLCSFRLNGRKLVDVNIKCKQCLHIKIQDYSTSLDEYIRCLSDRLRNNILHINKKETQSRIVYQINAKIIKKILSLQNGLCGICNEKLTHNKCPSKFMYELHPKNLVVEIINISEGYVANNIRLVCVTEITQMRTPGFITDQFDDIFNIQPEAKQIPESITNPLNVSINKILRENKQKGIFNEIELPFDTILPEETSSDEMLSDIEIPQEKTYEFPTNPVIDNSHLENLMDNQSNIEMLIDKILEKKLTGPIIEIMVDKFWKEIKKLVTNA